MQVEQTMVTAPLSDLLLLAIMPHDPAVSLLLSSGMHEGHGTAKQDDPGQRLPQSRRLDEVCAQKGSKTTQSQSQAFSREFQEHILP